MRVFASRFSLPANSETIPKRRVAQRQEDSQTEGLGRNISRECDCILGGKQGDSVAADASVAAELRRFNRDRDN